MGLSLHQAGQDLPSFFHLPRPFSKIGVVGFGREVRGPGRPARALAPGYKFLEIGFDLQQVGFRAGQVFK